MPADAHPHDTPIAGGACLLHRSEAFAEDLDGLVPVVAAAEAPGPSRPRRRAIGRHARRVVAATLRGWGLRRSASAV
ncbi:MAG: hypothetical protein MUF03_04230 [Rubrivivax sp.]|jgi:hypothetical protein|nr:hypothetical protein [Rubrivivax sp.]